MTKPTKESRLHLRCQREDKERIEKAAQALGLSLSDYLLSAALERRPPQASTERLSATDTRSLLAYIFAEPAQPTPRMRRAVEHYKALIEGSEEA